MKERLVTIRNRAGIHCRPSGVILNAVNQDFPYHRFTVTAGENTIELNSILALISLGLAQGATASLRCEGPDEENAVRKIGDLFEKEFDFPPR
ncbi:MAG: HPr family phosphocarrier protein [Victivallaceae bacterium]|nr:HPr family phosphocarrier protein [Victivallaceae bacterium]